MIDVRKGSLARAYQTLTSQDFRETTSLSHLVAFVSQYPSLRRNRSVDLIKIQYHENVASINVELTSTEHENEVALFSVRYDEGRWRIISIQIFPPPPK